jgi:hypothetical protein
MSNEVLSSLAEAQAVFKQHCAEQKREGRRTEPDAWLRIEEKTLVVVVYGFRERNGGHGPITIPYEYPLDFPCAGLHEITAPERGENGNRKAPAGRFNPLRQLHMFKAG